jgi:Replication-relaxation
VRRARPDTAAELRYAEGKLLVWDASAVRRPCALQPRDTEVLAALGKYRFLTTVQIADHWWPGCALQVVRRRLTKLFEAGYVERFRPWTIRGSFQWIYCLARDGHRAAQQTGELPADLRFTARREQIFDYRYVVHDLRVNDWVLAYSKLVGEQFVDWHGPDAARLDPPKLDELDLKRVGIGEHVSGMALKTARALAPDAGLEMIGREGRRLYFFVEYDRTRRVDKNYDKFRRYDLFLGTWRWRSDPTERGAPYVLFLCEDETHLERFVAAADRELTGNRWHWGGDGVRQEKFDGRDRVLFARADDVYRGDLSARRVPLLPPGHDRRGLDDSPREAFLPGAKGR